MRLIPTTLLTLLIVASGPVMALDAIRENVTAGGVLPPAMESGQVHQGSGMTLEQAVAQVRKQYNGRIVSAETRVSGGKETHVIKVLTSDGKVKTVRIPGRRR
jgi:hypothetical protein